MNRNLNIEAKSLPNNWQSNNAMTVAKQVEGVEHVTQFSIPFSNVVLYRARFEGIGNTLRQLLLNVPAVYAIVMSSERDAVQSCIYVGSSGNAEERFQKHQYDPRFASKAHTVFLLTTTSLEANSAHMRFAEGFLNRMTADQPHTEVVSQDVPAFKMSAHDEYIVKKIIKDAITLLAAAGYPMTAHTSLILKNIPFMDASDLCDVEREDCAGTTSNELQDVLWEFDAPAGVLKTYEMRGAILLNGRFLVFPGSHYRVDEEHNLPPNLAMTRAKLEAGGYLRAADATDGRLELVFPYEFASPKQAVHAMLKSNKPIEGYWSQTPMGCSSSSSEL